MKRVEHTLYAEQDETTSRLVLHVEGDVPVMLVSYSRAFVEHVSDFVMLEAGGDSVPDMKYIGVSIVFQKGDKP